MNGEDFSELILSIKEAGAIRRGELKIIHPGEILQEEYLKPLEMSAQELAVKLQLPIAHIDEILCGRRPVTLDTALRLSRFFSTSVELWVGLQSEYDSKISRPRATARM